MEVDLAAGPEGAEQALEDQLLRRIAIVLYWTSARHADGRDYARSPSTS